MKNRKIVKEEKVVIKTRKGLEELTPMRKDDKFSNELNENTTFLVNNKNKAKKK